VQCAWPICDPLKNSKSLLEVAPIILANFQPTILSAGCCLLTGNKKHLKNVGPIRHCEPPHALILHCHSPCRYCRTPPAHRCPRQRQQRQRVTEGTAMAPWNGSNKTHTHKHTHTHIRPTVLANGPLCYATSVFTIYPIADVAWLVGRVDSAFDSCLKDSGSNPARNQSLLNNCGLVVHTYRA